MTTEVDRNDIAFLRAHLDSALDSFKQAAQERDALRAENERLRAAVLAYDDLIRVSAQRGQRVIDDDPRLDELYEAMIRAAGRDFNGWQTYA